MLQLFKFKGGVKPQTNKAQSVTAPIAVAPLPKRIFMPLHQSIGGTPRPLVQAGEKAGGDPLPTGAGQRPACQNRRGGL